MTGRKAGKCTNYGAGRAGKAGKEEANATDKEESSVVTGGRGAGQGPRQGKGRGQGQGQSGAGRGRMGGAVAGGPVGNCICPKCKTETAHQRGVPCSAQTCPKCGTALIRTT